MTDLALPPVDGYDADSQPIVGFMAAQLEDQLRRLKESVGGLSVEALEWQIEPGRNTVGMLLAHIAVAEAWWFQAGAKGITDRERVSEILKAVIGIEPQDDGMPMPEGGTHPEVLAGRGVGDYVSMIDRARVASHVVLRGWADTDLSRRVDVRDRSITRGWILYHVLEHFVAHYGQILLIMRMLRERGLAAQKEQE